MRIEGSIQNALQELAKERSRLGIQNNPEDFGQMLMDVMKDVNQSQLNAREVQNQFMTGQPGVEIHDVKIAAEKASIAIQLTMQVRNKVLEAYQELSRMQV